MMTIDNEFLMGFRAQSMGRDQNEVIAKMRALPPGVVDRYLSADYETPHGVLNIGEMPPEVLGSYSWAIITACTDRPSEADDEMLADMLER